MIGIVATVFAAAQPAFAAVVILVNRSSATTRFTLSQPGEADREVSLKKGDLTPVVIGDKMQIAYYSGKADRKYALQADSIYVFGTVNGELMLEHVGLRSPEINAAAALLNDPALPVDKKSPEAIAEEMKKSSEVLKIPVKILVDDDEQATRRNWETRLSKRIEAVSDILEHTCRVRLAIVENRHLDH